MFQPRLRGFPRGLIGQPFYGWLRHIRIVSEGRFNGLPESFQQIASPFETG
jgi:hypothetical protein